MFTAGCSRATDTIADRRGQRLSIRVTHLPPASTHDPTPSASQHQNAMRRSCELRHKEHRKYIRHESTGVETTGGCGCRPRGVGPASHLPDNLHTTERRQAARAAQHAERSEETLGDAERCGPLTGRSIPRFSPREHLTADGKQPGNDTHGHDLGASPDLERLLDGSFRWDRSRHVSGERVTRQVTYCSESALRLLRLGSGIQEATFRAGQEEAIRHIVEGRGRLLVVQRTGWGKSLVYFIATKLLREAGGGPALLISPLLALMRNQIAAAERMGMSAATINSDNQGKWTAVEERARHNDVDILVISPERLANDRFVTEVLGYIADRISLLVIDEAHCISDWGHDFRPHYRLFERIVTTLPRNLRLLATTATANDRVMQDLRAVLGPGLDVLRGDLNRTSLSLQTLRLPGQSERLAWLAQRLAEIQGHGIIYTLTVRDADLVAAWLQSRGFRVEAYTSDTGARREALEEALLRNELKALVATTALGMGYDKPDLAFVIHYQAPGSVVAYYQQVGRAGRALPAAYGVLLSGEEEMEITTWFIQSAFPAREEVAQVLGALQDSPQGLTVPELMEHVNSSKGRIEKTIALLSLESPAPVMKRGTRWQITDARLSDGFWKRADRLTKIRQIEQEQMQEYLRLPFGEHMRFLVKALDGDTRTIRSPALRPLPLTVDPILVREAQNFLERFRHCAVLTSCPTSPVVLRPRSVYRSKRFS